MYALVIVCMRCVFAHTYIILLLVSPARQVPKPVYHRQTRFLNRFASSALRVERPLVALALPWSPKSVPSQLPVISGVIIVVRAWLKYFLHELPVSRYSLPRNKTEPNCVCECGTKRILTRRRRNNQIIREKSKNLSIRNIERRQDIRISPKLKRKSCAKIWNDIVPSVKLVYEKGKNCSLCINLCMLKRPSAEIVLEKKCNLIKSQLSCADFDTQTQPPKIDRSLTSLWEGKTNKSKSEIFRRFWQRLKMKSRKKYLNKNGYLVFWILQSLSLFRYCNGNGQQYLGRRIYTIYLASCQSSSVVDCTL